MRLLHREPHAAVSPSNGILEVAISARTIPKLERDKQESQYSFHHVFLPSNGEDCWAMPTGSTCLCVRLNLASFPSSAATQPAHRHLLGGTDTPVYFTGPLVRVVDVFQVLWSDVSQHRDLFPVLLGFPLDG